MKNMLFAAFAVGATAAFTLYLVQQKQRKKLIQRRKAISKMETVRAPQFAMG